jgi:poly(3-hydroxyalkanoate) synthetase
MRGAAGPPFSSTPFLWPALAAVSASELATTLIKEIARATVAPDADEQTAEPRWATHNRVLLELASVRLRAYAPRASAPGTCVPRRRGATLVIAPFALHGATIVDFAPHHSLVAALAGASARICVTDWRSADATMQFFSIDTYLADLNVLVDHLDGGVDLVGLCQGGWLALMYAARFPHKVGKLVLAGAPVDIAAGQSRLSELARTTPMSTFRELVRLGGGCVRGVHALQLWGSGTLDAQTVHQVLQTPEPVQSARFRRLEARFREWYDMTVDLPGTYYVQVVERLFKQNQLAAGHFVALGQKLDLRAVRMPLLLLAARHDDVVAPDQIFATTRLVGTPRRHVNKMLAPCGHLGLFMGRAVLGETWPQIAQWLAAPT